MNPRVLLIVSIVLVLLVVGSVAAYFKLFKAQANPQAEAEQALKKDSDSDGVPDVEERLAGTNENDPNEYPEYQGRPASHKKVLVSRASIPPNTLVRDDMVDVKKVAAKGVAPDGTLLEPDRARIVGHISQMEIKPGDFLLDNMVYGGRPQLSYLIPKYKRAIALRYEPLSTVNGLVNIGDVVDIIGNFYVNRRVGGTTQFTKIFVQNARIVALGAEFIPRAPGDTTPVAPPTGFTLSVYPHEAERLIWAEASGARLVCALRSPQNDVLAKTNGTTDELLFGKSFLHDPRSIEVYGPLGIGNRRTQFDPVTGQNLSL